METYRDLLSQIHTNCKNIPFHKKLSAYNIFDVLEIQSREVIMCRFLTNLLTQMPAWAVIVIMSREFIISGFRLVAAEKGVTNAASYWGKVKTVVQMIMSILLIIHFEHPVFRIINPIFIYAAVLLTIISLVDYIYKNREVMKDIE